MKQKQAQAIIENTKTIYDKIAPHFNVTRYTLWPELFEFKKMTKAGEQILDLGCGNGRLLKLFKNLDIEYTGVDNSAQLLEQARTHFANQNFILADMNQLPFEDNAFDQIYCIATLHHLPSTDLRNKAVQEAHRILKPGGHLFMTNWNLWQKKYFHLIVNYTLLKFIGKNKMDFKDILIPWTFQQTDEVFERYYHAFTNNELKNLAQKNNFNIIKQELADHSQQSSMGQAFNFVSIWQKK